jgi:nucleotide-binding universal stress UspA family protein
MKEVTREFERILVAVDGSPQSMRAVDVAVSLAKKYSSMLTALYVIHIPFGETLLMPTQGEKYFASDIVYACIYWPLNCSLYVN